MSSEDRRVVNSELITVVSRQVKVSKTVVDDVVEVYLKEIEKNLLRGNRIILTGFGRFDTRVRPARRFYSSLVNRELDLPSVVVPTFHYSLVLVDKVKKHFS